MKIIYIVSKMIKEKTKVNEEVINNFIKENNINLEINKRYSLTLNNYEFILSTNDYISENEYLIVFLHLKEELNWIK